MNTFYKYYSGEKTAPILTIFIGGNHEASNHLLELYCSAKYFVFLFSLFSFNLHSRKKVRRLGSTKHLLFGSIWSCSVRWLANCRSFGHLQRFAFSLSFFLFGLNEFTGYNYQRGFFETLPFSDSDLRSVYHIREFQVLQLQQLTGNVDIFLSHDWPQGIVEYGDKEFLFRFKPFLREEAISLFLFHYLSNFFPF
jgi:lariat debranching enzyme